MACLHRRLGRDKTVFSRPCRRCEEANSCKLETGSRQDKTVLSAVWTSPHTLVSDQHELMRSRHSVMSHQCQVIVREWRHYTTAHYRMGHKDGTETINKLSRWKTVGKPDFTSRMSVNCTPLGICAIVCGALVCVLRHRWIALNFCSMCQHTNFCENYELPRNRHIPVLYLHT